MVETVGKTFLEDFDYKSSLLFSGPTGVGKTYIASKIAKKYKADKPEKLWLYEISDAKFKEFVQCGKMGHRPDSEHNRSLADYALEMILMVDVLFYDDIGVSDVTDAYIRKLTYILDERNAKGKVNIFTTNLSEDELREKLDDRIVSRLLHNCIVIVMTGDDRRRSTTKIVKLEL